MADAVGALAPEAAGASVRLVPLSPSDSVTSPLPELPRKSPMFELYVANVASLAGPRPRGAGCGSEGAVIADGHARAAARGAAAAQLHEPGHPVAVAGVRGEEL